MSDSTKGFTVVLRYDIGEEATERLRQAIEMFEPVQEVVPLLVDADDYMARDRAKFELRQQLWGVLK